MKYGYVRLGPSETEPQMQAKELADAGCSLVYTDYVSGVYPHKPHLEQLLGKLRPGDSLVVTRLDRLCRDLTDLVNIARRVQVNGAGLVSLQDGIDSSSEGDFFNFLDAMERFNAGGRLERDQARVIREAPKQDRQGHPAALTDEEWDEVHMRLVEGDKIADIAEEFDVSRDTIYRRRRQDAGFGRMPEQPGQLVSNNNE